MKPSAVYPGTFDPFTRGHEDIVRRAASIFDRVVIAIAVNPSKTPTFPIEQRVELARGVLADLSNVEVEGYTGLTVEFARARGISVIVRGLRAVSDFEFEFQLANMGRHLEPDVETVFMMPAEAYSYLSSRLVRQLGKFGGSVQGLVPESVERRLRAKFADKGPQATDRK